MALLVPQAIAQDFPNTVAGKRAAAFWNVVTSNDDKTTTDFVTNQMVPRKNMSIKQRAGVFSTIRELLDGAKIKRILGVRPNQISLIVAKKGGELEKIVIDTNENQSGLVEQISIEEASADDLDHSLNKSMSKDALIPAIKTYLNDLTQKDEFSGTVLIAKDGKPIFSQAYGFANRNQKTPNNIETKYNLGSINKLFTILAIGILADEGKLSFDDKLGEHLPSYPNKDARQKVTIKHLLTMSSGIGDIFGKEYSETPKSELRTTSSYLPLFASKPLAFEPGTERQYSNGGFLVLGALIEKVSGQTYYDFVRSKIHEPIGMNETESYESDKMVPNLAEGYMFSKEKKTRVNNVSTRPARGSSGGGGYSTAPDMLKFANAIESGSFQMPKSLKQMKDRLISSFSRGAIRFGGGAPGINSAIVNKVGSGYSVIVLTNFDPPTASKTSRKIRELIKRTQ